MERLRPATSQNQGKYDIISGGYVSPARPVAQAYCVILPRPCPTPWGQTEIPLVLDYIPLMPIISLISAIPGGRMSIYRNDIVICTQILIFNFIFLFMSGCSTTGTVAVTQSKGARCSNILPAVAEKEHNISTSLANTAVQQLSVGKIDAKYVSTVKTLLSNEATSEWIRAELICQTAKGFEDNSTRLWFLTMKEVAERTPPEQFLQWLKDNPRESFDAEDAPVNLREQLQSEPIRYDDVYGTIYIPQNAVEAHIKKIGTYGEVHVPGSTKVIIDKCYGNVYSNDKASVIIRYSSTYCNQHIR